VGTAHPAKFKETIESAAGIEVELPESLAKCLNKEKFAIELNNEYSSFKEYLLSIC
jgi:threonine synthase